MGTSAIIFPASTVDWSDSAIRWCDFAGAVQYIAPPGFTGGTLILLRRLEAIAATRQVSQTPKDKRNNLIIDLILGFGIPLIMLALRIIIQGHRMDIIPAYGCNPPVYVSIPQLFVHSLWQLVLSLVCVVYAILVLRWFLIRRAQLTSVLQSCNSGLNKNKYIRLMILAGAEVVITFPASVFIFGIAYATAPIQPYTSWADVHYEWNTVYLIPWDSMSTALQVGVEVGRWLPILGGIFMFVIFGLTADARSQYVSWWRVVTKPFLPHREQTTHNGSIPALPRAPEKPRIGYTSDPSLAWDEEKDLGTERDGSLNDRFPDGTAYSLNSSSLAPTPAAIRTSFGDRFGPLSEIHALRQGAGGTGPPAEILSA
ncbi:pheromone receptor [Ceraceosorus bombacis]|uniref:Pheromone receptor n=1 Tax=Ceraceosorus bombacis TaxID=401625 RepID=A0A0P1BA60_9BASI|nr:pheromone receptor [Ceraceosorus bombacis]